MTKQIVLLIFIFCSVTQAEYRVYLLQITNEETNITRTVRSTFAQGPYQQIHPLSKMEKITQIDSWKCHGNTSQFKILCSSEPISREPTQSKVQN